MQQRLLRMGICAPALFALCVTAARAAPTPFPRSEPGAAGRMAIDPVSITPVSRTRTVATRVMVLPDGRRAVVETLPPAPVATVPKVVKVAGIEIATTGGSNAPRVVRAAHRLECVPFARALSGIDIYGDARTWWKKAKGLYAKLASPEPGAVMVFASTRRIRRGHVAVVKNVVSAREVRVDHANWGNNGKIYLNAPVVDVSRNNDWSEVRVWNARLGALGSHVYRLAGFIGDYATQ